MELKIIAIFFAAMTALTIILGSTAHAGSWAWDGMQPTHVLHCYPDPLGSGGVVCR